jgi:hypothetical protein
MSRWFTEADWAELDVVAHALNDCAWEHRERCAACRERRRFCPALGEAIDAAIDWSQYRALRSKADALRRRHLQAALSGLTERREAA